MGAITLANFRDEMTSILGGRDATIIDNPRKNRWVNFAYLDVTGAVEFEELIEEAALVVPSGAAGIAVPSQVRSVASVTISSGPLEWIGLVEYYRVRGQSGTPEWWRRVGNTIRLAPNPSSATNVTAVLKKEPVLLVNDADVSDIPSTWDQAILYLSCSHAFYAIGEDQRGVLWLNRAIAYIQTRANEELRRLVDPGLGGTLRFIQERAAILSSEGGA